MAPRPGLSASVSMQVTDDDTACAFHSGDVEVLATPRVVALAEEASIKAIEGSLEKGITTVGYRVQLDHLAPIGPGGTVQAEATLETVEGKRLTFRVSVTDTHGGLVAAGRITRVSVERQRFMEKAQGS
jgi:fluoroacetyl-CoA thioesterase